MEPGAAVMQRQRQQQQKVGRACQQAVQLLVANPHAVSRVVQQQTLTLRNCLSDGHLLGRNEWSIAEW
jgi:hypothetical protein